MVREGSQTQRSNVGQGAIHVVTTEAFRRRSRGNIELTRRLQVASLGGSA